MENFKNIKFHTNSIEHVTESFWKSLSVGSSPVQLDGSINDIAYCPVAPYNYAVTCNFQIHLLSSVTDAPLRRIPVKTRAAVLTALAWRADGALIGAGDDSGYLRVFDTASRTQLRMFQPAQAASAGGAGITGAKFTCDKRSVLSSTQDGLLNLWDISQESEPLLRLKISDKDQIRGLSVSQQSPWLVASGAYDGFCRLHDTRSGADTGLAQLNHGFPVESVLLSPDDQLLYTAGECWVRVFSLAQRRQVAAFRRHHKTVTRLALARSGSRLLSAGLDGLVKVTDCLSYEEVHHYEYHHAQILSMGIAPDESSMAVGTVDRWLHKRRTKTPEELAAAALKSGVAKRQQRLQQVGALDKKPRLDDVVRPHPQRSVNLEKYEKMLKMFRHSDALTEVLKPAIMRLHPDKICAVMNTLVHRQGLRTALAGRPEAEVVRLVRFVHHNLLQADRCALLTLVAEELLHLYSDSASNTLLTEFNKLRGLLGAEVEFAEAADSAMGQIDLLLGEISAFPAQIDVL